MIVRQCTAIQIPSDNSSNVGFSGYRLILFCRTGLDRSCVDSGNSANIVECRTSEVLSETAAGYPACIQSYYAASSGITGHISGIGTVVDLLVFKIDTDDSPGEMHIYLICTGRNCHPSDLAASKICPQRYSLRPVRVSKCNISFIRTSFHPKSAVLLAVSYDAAGI